MRNIILASGTNVCMYVFQDLKVFGSAEVFGSANLKVFGSARVFGSAKGSSLGSITPILIVNCLWNSCLLYIPTCSLAQLYTVPKTHLRYKILAVVYSQIGTNHPAELMPSSWKL